MRRLRCIISSRDLSERLRTTSNWGGKCMVEPFALAVWRYVNISWRLALLIGLVWDGKQKLRFVGKIMFGKYKVEGAWLNREQTPPIVLTATNSKTAFLRALSLLTLASWSIMDGCSRGFKSSSPKISPIDRREANTVFKISTESLKD